jgi:hypothetical protein
MSNDSDFMVFSNIGGLIPFQDIRFVTDDTGPNKKRVYALRITSQDVARITNLQNNKVC